MAAYPKCPMCGAVGRIGDTHTPCACVLEAALEAFVEPAPVERCIIWCPTRDAEQFAHDLSAPVLLTTTPKEERAAIIAKFGETDRGILVVATTYGVHGYRFPRATPYFLDGCPSDTAWRWQARARSEYHGG